MGCRVELPVESFHQDLSALVCLLDELLRFRGIRGERLLDKNMFAGLERLDGPFEVQAVWSADIDNIDSWIGK